MPDIWMRIRELFRGARLDGELDEEVGLHLQMMEEEFRRRGMSETEAMAAARREFGGGAPASRPRRSFRWRSASAPTRRFSRCSTR